MIIIVLLISISLLIAILFLVLFLWNMRSGQYDDTYTPSVRILFNDTKNTDKNQDDNRRSSGPRD